MHFISEQLIDGNLVERHFTLDGIPGILWMPDNSPEPLPLVLLGLPGGPNGLEQMHPRLLRRAQQAAAEGFAAAALELPGGGIRPGIDDLDKARVDLQRAIKSGEPVSNDIVDRLVLPLVDQAVPELQALLDALLALPEIGGPVGYSGGVISIGVRLAAVDPRVVAAQLFAGSFVPRAIHEQAKEITIPIHVLLQWDDEFNDRQAALDLYDAFGSAEKTLEANLGGHRGVPGFAGHGFLARHLS